jgi:peroxiredoxin
MKLPAIALFIIFVHSSYAQDIVKLSGKIQNPLSDTIEVSYNNNRIAYYPNEYFGHIDKKGKFSMSFPVPAGIYVQAEIRHGNSIAEVMLHGGDSLVLSANGGHFDSSIHYTGRGSEIQNFIARHSIAKGRMNQYTTRAKEAINKEPEDFLKAIEKEKKGEIDFLERNKAGLPELFVKYWTAFYQYYNYFFTEQYPQIHEMIKQRRYTDTVPEANYIVTKNLPFAFNDTLLQVPSYLLYLTGIFEVKMKAAGYSYVGRDTVKIHRQQDSVNTMAYKMLPGKSAEYFVAQNIYGRARNQEPERTDIQFAEFKSHWPESEYMPLLERQISMGKRLAAGQPAPDFDIVGADGRKMKLSDLRGKVVYLGFWAGYCRQCLAEMLRERNVKDLIRNKPLEFVYVSIGNDTATERTLINKYKMEGIFTDAVGGWYAKEVALYGVQGLPAYFLIDEDGKFAMQNAPTPTNPTVLILEIEKLFK